MTSLVETALDSGVLTITLADEERRNALSGDLVAALMTAFDEAETDPSVRVVAVTNRGSTFCAGANLSERSSGRSSEGTRTPGWALFTRIGRSSKPYVGRIAGHAVAGGMGLVAAMDISIAVDHAMFGFTEVRVGVAPAVISVVCLPKLRADARAAFLRGNRFSAAVAADMGLINAAVPAERIDAEVKLVVTDLLAGGPAALAATKGLLAGMPGRDDEAFARATRLSQELFAGEEAKEGMAAFLNKRPASWVFGL